MNQRPFVHITDAGMAFLEKRPDDGHPHQANYEKLFGGLPEFN